MRRWRVSRVLVFPRSSPGFLQVFFKSSRFLQVEWMEGVDGL